MSKRRVLVVSLTRVEEYFDVGDEIERLRGREVPLNRYTITVAEKLQGERENQWLGTYIDYGIFL